MKKNDCWILLGSLSLLVGACDSGPPMAGEITADLAEEVLLEGATAYGSMGDYFLRNEKVIAIIEKPGRVFGPSPYGGNLIDIGSATLKRDVLGESLPFLQFGVTADFQEVEVISDGRSGDAAIIEARGVDAVWDFLNIESLVPGLLAYREDESGEAISVIQYDPDKDLPLSIRVRYILEPDADAVEVRYYLTNEGESELAIHPGFGVDIRGQVEAFTTGKGFGDPGVDLDDIGTLFSDEIDTPFIGFQADGFSLGVRSRDYLDGVPQSRISVGVIGVALFFLGSKNILELLEPSEFLLAPGEERGFGFDLFVGTDIADVRTWAEGDADWATISGSVGVQGSNTPVPGARVVAYNTADGSIQNSFETDAEGSFAGTLPPGEYAFAADHLGHAPASPQAVSIAAREDVAVDLLLPASATVRVQVEAYADVESGLSAQGPCRVMLLGPSVDRSGGLCDVMSDCDGMQPFRHEKRWEHTNRRFRYAYNLQTCDTSKAPDSPLMVAPGKYVAIVSRGPEYDFIQQWVQVESGEEITIQGELRRVVQREGWVSGDFHVHQLASTDSIVANEERVRGYAAEGVDLFVTTDHDAVSDLRPVVRSLGLEAFVQTLPGCEVSTPDLGHFNGFPIEPLAGTQFGSPPDWGGGAVRPTPGEVFERMRGRGAEIVQVNHPRERSSYFNALALSYDLQNGVMSEDPERAPDPALLRMPAGSDLFSSNFDALEVYNGTGTTDAEMVMRDWFNMLSMGMIKTGTGVSDSHSAFGDTPGEPRTLVKVPGGAAAGVDTDLFLNQLKAGEAVITTGPMLEVRAKTEESEAGVGEILSGAKEQVTLLLSANTPQWYGLDTAELFINQTFTDPGAEAGDGDYQPLTPDSVITLVGASIARGNGGGALEYTAELPLGDLLPASGDAWLVVRVKGTQSSQFPVSLSGVSITYDQNATDMAGFMTASGGLAPMALANPILLDLNGNGVFDPPALTP